MFLSHFSNFYANSISLQPIEISERIKKLDFVPSFDDKILKQTQ